MVVHTCHLIPWEAEAGGWRVGGLGWGMAQVIEHLNKCKALISNPSTVKRERER
jgi:hypothetical protein